MPPQQIGWAGDYLILMGLCRIYLVHTQFFEAKFNAFILTTKWFQQLQLREKIKYKLGPQYASFSSLVKEKKKKRKKEKKKLGYILIHGWHFQVCKT